MDLKLPTTVLPNLKDIHWNLSAPELYEEIVRKHEGRVAHQGPIVAYTGQYTGRSPKDKFVVVDEATEDQVWWEGGEARKFTQEQYEYLRARQESYLQGRSVYVQDCYAGADPTHRLPVRIVTQTAWHNLFARNMFIQEPDESKLEAFEPAF
ncbi:MAG: phosphoenolpyruvate carboxykinase (ATP), partial [Planctomycetota bacterium]